MELIVNDKNEIVGFNYLSREGIQIDQEEAPDEMLTDFLSKKWIWSDDKIIDNQNYQEPNITDPGPSQTQQQLAQVIYQQMMTTQDVTTLQTQNAQMAYQLMMQKQGGEA